MVKIKARQEDAYWVYEIRHGEQKWISDKFDTLKECLDASLYFCNLKGFRIDAIDVHGEDG